MTRKRVARVRIRGTTGWGAAHLVPYPFRAGQEALCGRVIPEAASGNIQWLPPEETHTCTNCERIHRRHSGG